MALGRRSPPRARCWGRPRRRQRQRGNSRRGGRCPCPCARAGRPKCVVRCCCVVEERVHVVREAGEGTACGCPVRPVCVFWPPPSVPAPAAAAVHTTRRRRGAKPELSPSLLARSESPSSWDQLPLAGCCQAPRAALGVAGQQRHGERAGEHTRKQGLRERDWTAHAVLADASLVKGAPCGP